MGHTATILIDSSGPATLDSRLATLLPDVRTLRCRPWELLAHAAPAEILVLGGALVDEAVLRVAPGLRLVQLLGPLLDRVDLRACQRQGVYVANLPWGNQVRETGEARLVEGGEPAGSLAASTLARIVASNVRRLLRGQAPLFWSNPPDWLDPEEARCGRAVVVRPPRTEQEIA